MLAYIHVKDQHYVEFLVHQEAFVLVMELFSSAHWEHTATEGRGRIAPSARLVSTVILHCSLVLLDALKRLALLDVLKRLALQDVLKRYILINSDL